MDQSVVNRRTVKQLASSSDRALQLIGVECGLGAPALGAAGCARAPAALLDAGILSAAARHGDACFWSEPIIAGVGLRNQMLEALCRGLAATVARSIVSHNLPVVIGGDHAIAAGTWRGAARVSGYPFGLLWIDAHLDAHTPATSPSGNLHGMPLAALLGAGIPGLANVDGPDLNPHHLCIVGVRSFEAAEMRLLRRLGVRIFEMPEIRRRGLSTVMSEALVRVRDHTSAFGVSIDVDAIAPEDAPGVSTPSRGGFSVHALRDALRGLGRDSKLAAIEIAEYNPDHDIDGRTAKVVCSLLERLMARGSH